MTALDTSSTQDIDALLAEADSLMNDMDSSLGGSEPAESATSSGESVSDSTRASSGEEGETIRDVVDGLSNFTENVDPDAVAKCLDGDASGQGAEAGEKTTQVAGEGPKAAPAEWVKEAGLGEGDGTDTDGLPHIPEARSDGSGPEQSDDVRTAATNKRSFPVRLAGRIARVPVDILIVLDYPFASLDMEIKSLIGYTAIATLLVATGTLAFGIMKH